MNKLLTVSPSPHIQSKRSVSSLMRDVVIALMPAFAVSVCMFGWGALYVTVVSIAACMFFEALIERFLLHKSITLCDGSAVVTGLLLAFNVPTNLPVGILIFGALVAIGVGKMTFGGLGNNPFNPALVGRVVLLISFPEKMTSWPEPAGFSQGIFDAVTGATPLGVMKGGMATHLTQSQIMESLPSYMDMLIGRTGGSMGEVAALALLVGFVYLLAHKVITCHIPVSILLTVAVFTGIFWIIDPTQYANPLFHILSGGLLLGAIFMATDYVTSPMSKAGMVVYGIGIGILTVLIRMFGIYPEGVSFAILIMNALVPLINMSFKPQRFGEEVHHV